MTSIHVQVLLAGTVVPEWQAACIRALRAVDGIAVSVSAGGFAYRAPRGLRALITGPSLAASRVDADRPATDEAQITLDLTGAAAAIAVGETWRFRIGEADAPTAPFLREIARGDRSITIELLRSDALGDCTIRRGRFPVTRWHPSTLRWSLLQAAQWPAILAAARREGVRPATLAAVMPPVASRPQRLERARFGAMLLRRLAGYAIERLFERAEWNVGFASMDLAAVVAGEPLDVRWLPQPARGTFIADPFVVERDGQTALFVEEYDTVRNRGVIAALALDENDGVTRRESVIDLPTHLSYPFPVSIGGELYIVPENSAGREVALYRCLEFPWRWVRESSLFSDFDGLDTTLFEHAGRWWALCTRASRGSDFALYAFYAPSPRGPWQPHPLNPVVEDVSCARPAGAPFVVDGALYRCGQDCTKSYGGGLAIARIDELTPAAYRETVVRRLVAESFGRYRDGVHTLGTTPRGIVLDGKRTYLDPGKPMPRMGRTS